MTKEEISKEIEECEKKLKNLRDELNNLEYSGKRWKPRYGDRYFYVSADGDIFNFKWDGSGIDKALYTLGDVFPTHEAAEFEVERRRVIADLSDYAEGDDAIWDRQQRHWSVCWSFPTKTLFFDWHQTLKPSCLSFPSEEAARAAVDAVGEDRVKKYYLGVKE